MDYVQRSSQHPWFWDIKKMDHEELLNKKWAIENS